MDADVIHVPEQVPVFPLPQVVLFPGTLLPLHVFEPRYRSMTADALATSPIIATALLKPGYEPLYYTRRAPIHPVIGLGHIVSHEQVPDGNYNILLRGIARARIVDESNERSYRLARIVPIQSHCSGGDDRAQQLRNTLQESIQNAEPLDPELKQHWLKLFGVELDLNDLSDLISAGLPAPAELRQCLLNEPDAAARMETLIKHVQTLRAIQRNVRQSNMPEGPALN